MNLQESWGIYLISFAAFLGALAAVQGLYLLWQGMHVEQTTRVNRRLKAMTTATIAQGGKKISLLRERQFSDVPWINRVMLRVPRLHAVDHMLEQSGLELSVSRYMLIQLILSMMVLVLLLLFTPGNLIVVVPLSLLVGFMIPYIFVGMKRAQRVAAFQQQIPDAMDYLARSLRAGNPFTASMRSASDELPEPIAGEFRTTFEELNFGLDLEEALHNMGERTGSEELRYFITSVLIQRTTGGNLAEVLNRISKVMRSRASTLREIQVLAAEMKYSANILIALPIFVALALSVLNPTYLSVLFESELGLVVIGLQLLFMAIGYVIIQKMINFRV